MISTTAPYSASENVIKVLERYRETTFGGGALTPQLVQKLSLGAEVSRRVVLSLKQLELIDEEGMPTEALLAFEKAPTDKYRGVLAAHLRGVYAPVFNVLGPDLSKYTSTEIEDQFRDFSPKTLRGRMAKCFMGLCVYTGLAEAAPVTKAGPKPARPSPTSSATNRPARSRGGEAQARERGANVDIISVKGASEAVTALLSSGGALIIAYSGKVADLNPSERAKVFELFDEVKMLGNRLELMPGRTPSEERNP